MAGRYDFRGSTRAQQTNPVVQQHTVQQPTVQQPVVQQPVVQQPTVQQPVVQQPIVQPQRPGLRLRRLSDSTDTDTESVATEDTATDNGEERPTNREVRRLLIWQAKVRWNNRIDHVGRDLWPWPQDVPALRQELSSWVRVCEYRLRIGCTRAYAHTTSHLVNDTRRPGRKHQHLRLLAPLTLAS